MQKINVAIADQHEIIRIGLKGILNRNQSLRVSHTASNSKDLIQQIKCSLLKPDVVIIDYNLARINGFVASGKIQKELPKCKIILLTDTETKYMIEKQIPNNAHGFVSKSFGSEHLQNYIQKLCQN